MKARATLVAGLDRQAFDSALLLHGSMRERVRRAGRAANRRLSKFLAAKVVAVSEAKLFALTIEVKKSTMEPMVIKQDTEKISFQFIDAKYKNRVSQSIDANHIISATNFVLFSLDAKNDLFEKMRLVENRYVKLAPTAKYSRLPRVTLDIGAVADTSKTWMARDEKHVYVLWAADNEAIAYIAVLERKSSWAKGL